MTSGLFMFVVGPSGAGKDSLIDGAKAVLDPDRFVFARRVITRPKDSVGEDHEPSSVDAFHARVSAGQFLVSWQAHGLSYGLPLSLLDVVQQGQHVIANGSRNLVTELANKIQSFVVIEISAPPAVLAQRLSLRGRETQDDIAKRLNRIVTPYPPGVKVCHVTNDQTLEIGIERFLATIRTLTKA